MGCVQPRAVQGETLSSSTKRIKKVVEVEVGYFAKDGYFSPKGPGLAPIELPWPYFQPGERVLVEVTKIATVAHQKEKTNGRRGR